MSGLRIVIVDDHAVALEGYKQLFQARDIVVVGTALMGQDAIVTVSTTQPQVLLIDVRLDDLDGLSAFELIRVQFPTLPAVVISAYENPTYVARAVAVGASDYLLKSTSTLNICDSLWRAYRGEPAPATSVLTRIQKFMQQTRGAGSVVDGRVITGREMQVLQHMALGLSNKEIAYSLKISVETVKEHVQNVLRKTGAKDRTDAAVRAIRQGFVQI